MNESRFDELLTKYQLGQCNPEEYALVERWLDSLSDHSFDQIPPAQQEAIKNRMRRSLNNRIQPQKPVRRLLRSRFQIAASIVLLLAVGLGFWQWNRSRIIPQIAYADLHQIKKVILPDGSLVWLKDSSRLEYPSRFNGAVREVRLHGEALFEVAKNPEFPFIIHAGQMTTKVLGTSFNIKSRNKQAEVVVFTGKVTVSTAAQTITLAPSQKAVYAPQTQKIESTHIAAFAPVKQEYSQGTEYNMDFNDSSLAEVLARIEKKFDVQISYDVARLKNCLFTAELTDQSLENTLGVLTQTFGGTYAITDSKVELKGLSCN